MTIIPFRRKIPGGMEHISKLSKSDRKAREVEELNLDADCCRACLGRGLIEATLTECVNCHGTGYVL
jgi:RecJ-like exonuclease